MKNIENKNTMYNQVRISCSAEIKSLSSAQSSCIRPTSEFQKNIETVCECVCLCVYV